MDGGLLARIMPFGTEKKPCGGRGGGRKMIPRAGREIKKGRLRAKDARYLLLPLCGGFHVSPSFPRPCGQLRAMRLSFFHQKRHCGSKRRADFRVQYEVGNRILVRRFAIDNRELCPGPFRHQRKSGSRIDHK